MRVDLQDQLAQRARTRRARARRWIVGGADRVDRRIRRGGQHDARENSEQGSPRPHPASKLTRRACGETTARPAPSARRRARPTRWRAAPRRRRTAGRTTRPARTSGPLRLPGEKGCPPPPLCRQRVHRWRVLRHLIGVGGDDRVGDGGLPRPLCVRGDIRLLELAPWGSATTRLAPPREQEPRGWREVSWLRCATRSVSRADCAPLRCVT